MPPKKSKKDEPCYTKTSKAGKQYVTCEGEQKRKAKAKAKPKAPEKATEKQKELMRKRREAAKAKKAKAAKPKPKVDKELLQGIMSIMAEVGKEKGKSTQASKDENLALDKKARDGKLTNKDFIDFIYDDEKAFEQMRGYEEDMAETQGYNMNYWYSKVTKKNISSFDDLTDNQQERLQNIMWKDVETMTRKKMKSFYDERVKGKKFKSLTELKKLFIKEYDDTTFKH
tara:strand:- start:3220 stop:3903 length:684 start_codon:yes stop_codon:yes gene_type:complete